MHLPRRLFRAGLPPVAACAAALVLAACGGGDGSGSSGEGTIVEGPGVQATKPPWALEKEHLAQRVRILGLPEPGKETFHIHAQLRVYVDGLLQPVPARVAFDPARHILSGLHTHDRSGVIHLEADKPFKATLGDVFYLWGLRLAANEIGALRNDGDRRVQAFVNGKPIKDPAAYVLRKDDNIVVAYGEPGTFPTKPDTKLLQEANRGGSMACSNAKKGETKTSCVVEAGGDEQ
jgi:hypothetical protein